MRHMILSSVVCLAVPYISTFLITGMICVKKILNIICVFLFSVQILSEIFLILRIIQKDIIINVHISSCKAHIIRVRF